jgi:hypothetical protein
MRHAAVTMDNQPAPVPAPRPANDMLRFFGYEHLPARLQTVSKPIGDVARQMAAELPPSAETTAGLRKLLEAKDCFVRAALPPS